MTSHQYSSPLVQLAVRAYEAMVPGVIRTGLHNRWFARHSARWQLIRNTPGSVVSRISRPDEALWR